VTHSSLVMLVPILTLPFRSDPSLPRLCRRVSCIPQGPLGILPAHPPDFPDGDWGCDFQPKTA